MKQIWDEAMKIGLKAIETVLPENAVRAALQGGEFAGRISGGGKINFFIVFIGVIGGLAAWGILGLFVGPLVLTLFAFLLENYRLMWRAWVGEQEERPGA